MKENTNINVREAKIVFTLILLLYLFICNNRLTAINEYGRYNISGRQYNLYYGNLHSHTEYSHDFNYVGGTPQAAFNHARNHAHIQVLAITDHCYDLTQSEWNDTKNQAVVATIPDTFVGISGFELHPGNISYTPPLPHFNVFFTDNYTTWHSSWTLDSAYNWISSQPNAIAQFNHPYWDTGYNSFRYNAVGDIPMTLYEMQEDYPFPQTNQAIRYHVAIDSGWHVGIASNQDNHQPDWGDSNQLTGIWADSLTKNSIRSALIQMRTFATFDRNFSLQFRANGSWMGDSIRNGNIAFRIIANDPDPNDYIYRIDIITNGGVSLCCTIPGNTNYVEWSPSTITNSNQHRYFFVRVIENDSDYIQSSAIWTYGIAAIEEHNSTSFKPTKFVLSDNYPNPFASKTQIEYALPHECQVDLKIYNSSGIFVRTMKIGNEKAGLYKTNWNGCDNLGKRVAKGIYFYRLSTDEFISTKKMIKIE